MIQEFSLIKRRLFQFGRRLIQDFELHLDDGFRIICPGTSGLLINGHTYHTKKKTSDSYKISLILGLFL